jgi:hypothetical protein
MTVRELLSAYVFFVGLEHGEVLKRYDDHHDQEYIEVNVRYLSYGFECPVCNLSLDGDEVDDFEIEDTPQIERTLVSMFDERYDRLAARIEPDPWEFYQRR